MQSGSQRAFPEQTNVVANQPRVVLLSTARAPRFSQYKGNDMTPERAKELVRKHGRRLEYGKNKGRYECPDVWILEVPHQGSWRTLAAIELADLERMTDAEFTSTYCEK